MKKMMYFKILIKHIFLFLILVSSISLVYSIDQYSQETFTFTSLNELNTIISTSQKEVTFSFQIENSLNSPQSFKFNISGDDKWETSLLNEEVTLQPNQKKDILFTVSTLEELGYKRIVDSQGLSKYELDDEYFGEFDFSVFINSTQSDDDLEIVYSLDVYSPTNLPIEFDLSPSSLFVNPEFPISVRVTAQNLDSDLGVDTIISATLLSNNGDETKLNSKNLTFKAEKNIIDVQFEIPQNVIPGMYDASIIVRVDKGEGRVQSWELNELVEVIKYEKLDATLSSKVNFWAYQDSIKVTNLGNTEQIYEYSDSLSWYERIFLSTSMDKTVTQSGHIFSEEIQPGETKTLIISYQYGVLFLFIILIIIIVVIKVYLTSQNPLEVELEFNNMKRVKHEGVKSFKVKLGFENIRREEIDTLRIVFRMPSYLHVKDESFSLTPPTKVLKGSSKYKLIWEFKRFEKGDARILGFELMNSKGILGDIHFEDLEFEVISKSKSKKFYTKIKTIKG